MSRFLNSIAALTGQRHRSALSEDLAKLAFDLIMPQRLLLWHVREFDGQLEASTRTVITAEHPCVATGTSAADMAHQFSEIPAREQCFRQQRKITLEAKGGRSTYSYFLPILSGRHVSGVLELERHDAISPYQQRILDGLLQIYTNHIGLLDEAEYDPLTGLLNRRCFATTANGPVAPKANPAQEWTNPTARGWLAVLDLDHFKRVNDTFGHSIGDEVLVLFAQLIQKGFRSADRAYRFGGEEFVITISSSAEEDITHVFERFRKQVEAFRFPQVGQITVSVGYTTLKSKEDAAFAFERADKALYYAKSNGRNQVHCYEDLVARGVLYEKVEEDRGELMLF